MPNAAPILLIAPLFFLAAYAQTIISVSPSSLPAAGGHLTLTGTGFNAQCGNYQHALVGTTSDPIHDTTLMKGTSFTSCTSTQLVVMMNAGPITSGAERVYLVWPTGWTSKVSCETINSPSISGITTNNVDSLEGGSITISGSNFGSEAGVYTYLSVEAGVGGSITSASGTQIIGTIPAGRVSSAGLYLAWGSGPYTSYCCFSHLNQPTLTSVWPYNHYLAKTGIWSAIVFGTNLGTQPWLYEAIRLKPSITSYPTLSYTPISAHGNYIDFEGPGSDIKENCNTNVYTVILAWANGNTEYVSSQFFCGQP